MSPTHPDAQRRVPPETGRHSVLQAVSHGDRFLDSSGADAGLLPAPLPDAQRVERDGRQLNR